MPTQSTVEKAFVYVKDAVSITLMSVLTVVISALGVRGWNVLNEAEEAIKSIHEATDEAKKPLKTVNDIVDDVGGLFASGKRKTPNENEKIKQNKDEKKITTSNADALSGSGKNDGIDGIKGILTKFVNIVNKEIENYGKQSHNIVVKRSEYPGYFTKEEINDEGTSEREVAMSPIEYAVHQFNSFLNEISAPALDSEGNPIQNNDSKNVTKVGHVIDIFVNMVENIAGTLNNNNMKEALCNYEQELNNYKKNSKIIDKMKEIAKKYRTNNSENLYDEKVYQSLVDEYTSISTIIRKLCNGEKRGGIFSLLSTDDPIIDDEKNIINKYIDCKQIFEIYQLKTGSTKMEVCARELVAQLSKILIGKKKEMENMRLINQCNTAEKGLSLNNIGEYDILMQAAINEWTCTEYLENKGLSNNTIAFSIFQVMVTISKVSNALANVSISDITTVLSNTLWGNS